jgi:2,3-bisphosphoglycerate-independent phosphoglycerate mutase
MRQPKVILVVLDGWGHNPKTDGNAIAQAKKPNFDFLTKNYPSTLLSASGEEVGLPWGEIGSSEVGHLTIGSGRVVYQSLPRINKAIEDGSFYKNQALIEAIKHAKTNKSSLHLVGLISSGGVHSYIEHIYAILKIIKKQHFKGQSYIHMFSDGRDSPTKSAPSFISKLKQNIEDLHIPIQIASITGRYWAMDRDNHWNRTLSAYNCLIEGKGKTAESPEQAIDMAYRDNETDEFISPTVIKIKPAKHSFLSLKQNNNPDTTLGTIQNNDSVIFFNFRPDRMRQLVELFLFPRQDTPKKIIRKNLYITTISQYDANLPVHVALAPENVPNPLAEILSQNQLTQLHIAETEKYAHVTYFFDGGRPQPNSGEKWFLVPSPKVPTFDKKPEMSAKEITEKVIEFNNQTPFDFILINFANADMVGHSGNISAAIKGVEAIDKELGILYKTFDQSYIIITADHGNAEVMKNPVTQEIDTAHSINPVPLTIIHPSLKLQNPHAPATIPSGILADIAPTILSLYKINPPAEMMGYNLLNTLIKPN